MGKYITGIIFLCLATVGSGYLQGRLSNRWGVDQETQDLGKLLEEVPETESIGDWELVSSNRFDDEVVQMLACTGHISRVYRHRTNNWVVRMFAVTGPQGNISVHTPEICYSSKEYKPPFEKYRSDLEIHGDPHQFWTITMRARSENEPHLLRAWYGWTTKRVFEAPGSARWAFFGKPRLTKIQLACQLPDPDAMPDVQEKEAVDPCEDFLRAFLPVLADYSELK